MENIAKIIKENDACIIRDVVAKFYGYKGDEITLRDRNIKYREARQIACSLMVKHTNLPLRQIGNILGYTTHANCIHAREVVRDEAMTNKDYSRMYKEISKAVEEKLQNPTKTITIKIEL